MTDNADFQQLVRRRLERGAPCSLNPDEIGAIQALFEERDALAAKLVEVDRWCQRIAEDPTVPAAVRMDAGNLHRKAPDEAAARTKRLEEMVASLAAHVERIYDAWVIDDTGIHDKRVEHVRLPYLRYEAVNQAIMAAPTTSLAQLKDERAEAIQQAVKQARREWAKEDHAALARRDAEQQAGAIDKWSKSIIQTAEWAARKHNEDPSFPPINLQLFRELCCDMDDDADRLRRQAEGDPS